MSNQRHDIGHALRSIGDDFIENRPAELAQVRAGVERYRRRRLRVVTGAAALATGTAAFVFYLAAGSTTDEPPPPAGESRPAIVQRIELEGSPLQVAAKEDVAWVTRSDDGVVSRVEVGADDPAWEVDIGTVPSDIVATADGIWIADRDNDQIVQLDPDSGETVQTLPLAAPPGRIAVGENAIRATVDGVGVVKIDRDTGEPEILYEGDVIDIAMGSEAFWVMTTTGDVVPIDPDEGNIVDGLETPSVFGEGEITYLRHAIYYGQEGNPTLIRIDEATGEETDRIQLPDGYQDIDADANGLWALVRNGRLGRLVALDPATGAVLDDGLDLVDTPVDIVTGDEGVWVALASGGRIVLVD